MGESGVFSTLLCCHCLPPTAMSGFRAFLCLEEALRSKDPILHRRYTVQRVYFAGENFTVAVRENIIVSPINMLIPAILENFTRTLYGDWEYKTGEAFNRVTPPT